jgi:hypothetical protein
MLRGVRLLRRLDLEAIDTHSPYPVEGWREALGLSRARVPLVVLICGLFGATLGYLIQYYCNGISYPINVGGRPLQAWPAFIPITFETMVLCGGIGAFVGGLWLMGLPRWHHPIFALPAFRSATIDRFWVSARVATAWPGAARDSLVDALGREGALQVELLED